MPPQSLLATCIFLIAGEAVAILCNTSCVALKSCFSTASQRTCPNTGSLRKTTQILGGGLAVIPLPPRVLQHSLGAFTYLYFFLVIFILGPVLPLAVKTLLNCFPKDFFSCFCFPRNGMTMPFRFIFFVTVLDVFPLPVKRCM